MRDQSLDRLNGRSMAAFVTICELRLNMVCGPQERRHIGSAGSQKFVCAEIYESVKRIFQSGGFDVYSVFLRSGYRFA